MSWHEWFGFGSTNDDTPPPRSEEEVEEEEEQVDFDFEQDQHSFGNHDDVYLEDDHRQRGYQDLDNLDDDLEEEEEEEEQQQSNSRIPTRTAGPDGDVSEEDDFWESDDSDVSEEDESDDNM
jgi:hypothetical protein